MDVFIGGTVCFPNGWIVGTFVLFFVPSGLFRTFFCVCVCVRAKCVDFWNVFYSVPIVLFFVPNGWFVRTIFFSWQID